MTTSTKARPTAGKNRARESEIEIEDWEGEDEREAQFDLLTAALIGAAIGAGITLLVRRGPSGNRPLRPVLSAAGRGARWAGLAGLEGARWAGGRAASGARWAAPRAMNGVRYAADRGEDLMDRIPIDDITEQLRDYADSAREAINDVVKDELTDLKKAVRRQRKRIGI